ncbi:EpsI family protein [Sphingomonas jinjuensis]|uniref:EpsI family protein n=1 Tax=Sphingomonas jinjuensis TaxID=535907 RepID=A0A840FHG0_9SPHN|nr:exosortase-associated protein EpsI, V-type [Sphingomonas jinjuensis]MBB4152785.1 EpsI family protein [Sphingomonas jinjuensis]
MKLATDRRRLLMGGAMLGIAGLGQALYPRRYTQPISSSQFEALFPHQMGEWSYAAASGLVLPPQDQLSKMLYEQLMTRVYTQDGSDDSDAIMLLAAYSSQQEGRLQVHRPEVCYPAAGFTINSSRDVTVAIGDGKSIPARFLVTQRGPRIENVLYWTRVGNDFPLRWAEQRIDMAIDNLHGFVPDGLLGRVSMISPDSDNALVTLDGFFRSMLGALKPPGRKMLIGDR